MGYFIEGEFISRMAEIVAKRRKPEDTAMGLLDEMLDGLDLPGAEFGNDEDSDPAHPLGALLKEAFSPHKDVSEDDWHEMVTQPFMKKYGLY